MGAAGIFQLTEGYVKLVLHDDGLKNNEVLMADNKDKKTTCENKWFFS